MSPDKTQTVAIVKGGRRRGGLLIVGAIGVLAFGLAALLIVSIALPNLFGTTVREQPNAVVLARIQDMARFDAATGRFQTLVDQETDSNLLPDWVKGEHKVLVAEGDVEAAVDFSGLGADALETSEDGTSVTVHLPEPMLQEAQLDREATRVIARDRGVLDRIDDALTTGNPSNDDDLYARATDKLSEAAAQSDLQTRARQNTTDLMTKLLTDAGFDQVAVVYDVHRDPGQGA
jgi:hypothetical protein